MSSLLSFGNWKLLREIADGGYISLAPFEMEIERHGFATLRRFNGGITGLGIQYLKKHPCPPFPALGRNPDPRCPRCDELLPESLGIGEGR